MTLLPNELPMNANSQLYFQYFKKCYIVNQGFRLKLGKTSDDYFWVTFDHFLIEFFEAGGTMAKIGSSLNSNHHGQVISFSKSLIHIVFPILFEEKPR